METIGLKSISELLGMNFFIPSYQRGYRWTQQQVKDLLDDIQEFIDKKKQGFYCIQPLVVKKEIPEDKKIEFKEKLTAIDDMDALLHKAEDIISQYTKWEVIDGQQRLTTIYILLCYLGVGDCYHIEYETRIDSEDFLNNIDDTKGNTNIDYYHIIEAKRQIENWFKGREEEKTDFLKCLLTNVKFIWFESEEIDSIKIFTRLNVGKISLTNAELIKALFLNKSNFSSDDWHRIRLQQQEIAIEWDNIEYTLQNDEFWLFLNSITYDKPTRIDFIFDLIEQSNSYRLSDEEKNDIGNDEYKTFRYFYALFQKKKTNSIQENWQKVKQYFQVFQEWFNDLELYHYIGYLCAEVNGHKVSGVKTEELVNKWNEYSTKDEFKKYLLEEIKKTLKNCKDLDKQYEISGGPQKTQCRPILLLHNVQTVVRQNSKLKEQDTYKLPVFYKFPFHLFKKEKWDVEHIDSNTENDLGSEKERKEWLKYSLLGIQDNDLIAKIKQCLTAQNDDYEKFKELYEEIIKNQQQSTPEKKLSEDDKNKLWNFTLLDASTNRSYGNAPFPAKRRILIGKDQGVRYEISENGEITKEAEDIAFIPPCTKNVFLKYYNPSPNSLREWDKQDAEAYKKNIANTLADFLNIEKEGEKNEL
ncbi:DUF262 domain-containing protein [Parabacteroides sp. OttesenSCG-928-O15]|nr:DUF262 domain-containing protein [Parabacteroides sp. OttesenSCG-928-O15]